MRAERSRPPAFVGALLLLGLTAQACAEAEPDYSVQPPEATAQGGAGSGSSGSSAGGAASGQGGAGAAGKAGGQTGGSGQGGQGGATSGSSGHGGASATGGNGGESPGGNGAGGEAFGGAGGESPGGQGGASGQAAGGAGGAGASGKGQGGSATGGAGAGGAGAGGAGAAGTDAGGAGAAGAGQGGQGGAAPEGALVLGDSPDTTTQRIVQQGDDLLLRVVAGSGPPCKLSGSPFYTMTHYAYAQVYNPHDKAARVELGVGAQAGQPAPLMPILTAYAALPVSESERTACLAGAEISCPSNPSYKTCLSDKSALTVPPHGSIWAYVGNFDDEDPPVSFVLYARLLNFQ